LGIARTKHVDDDMRESPAVDLMELLKAQGASVDYSDPRVPARSEMCKGRFDLRSIARPSANISHHEFARIAANHDAFDFDLIKKHAKLIVNTPHAG
jgi:UDP-N-acetyl-D-glucosamine dehydrogenase